MYTRITRLPGKAETQEDSDDRREVCHTVANPLVEQRAVARAADGKGREEGDCTDNHPRLRLAMTHCNQSDQFHNIRTMNTL